EQQAPGPQAGSRAPRQSGRHRVTRHDTGIGDTRHQVIFGLTAGTASSGKAVGSESTGMKPRALGQTLDRLAGQRASGHQASGHLARQRGTRVIWQGSGLRVNWHDRGHWVRHWIVWLDSGHWVTRHQVIWLDSRAPRHLARQWAPSQLA
ncbi:unnamed protein product, partial [Staurois parvus]